MDEAIASAEEIEKESGKSAEKRYCIIMAILMRALILKTDNISRLITTLALSIYGTLMVLALGILFRG